MHCYLQGFLSVGLRETGHRENLQLAGKSGDTIINTQGWETKEESESSDNCNITAK